MLAPMRVSDSGVDETRNATTPPDRFLAGND